MKSITKFCMDPMCVLNVFYLAVNSSHLGPNVLPITLFSNTDLFSSLGKPYIATDRSLVLCMLILILGLLELFLPRLQTSTEFVDRYET
jgi:hypothetical protein